MRFYLAKTLNNMKMYGPIPDLLVEPEERVESYIISEEEIDWILENMVYDINYHCGTNLDDGDYDFVNPDGCRELINYLDNLPKDFVPSKYKGMIEKLKEYAQRAIEYNTGIAIEL